MTLKFEKKFGPGKCSKCGVYIEGDVQMYTATNLSGRPSLVKDQLILLTRNFVKIVTKNCHKRINKKGL